MLRPVHIVAATALLITVLVICISPVTDLLPAPLLKHTPAADLFASVLLLMFALAMQAFFALCIQGTVRAPVHSSERLELLCLRRC